LWHELLPEHARALHQQRGLQRRHDLRRRGVHALGELPQIKCQWPGNTPPAEFPNSVQVIGTPMVIDFDFDNNPQTHSPSIVFVSYEGDLSQINGVLRVINGEDCTLQDTISDPDHPFIPEVSPALGDVDGDGRPEIVVVDVETTGSIASRSGVAVYSVGSGTQFRLLARQNSSLATQKFKGLTIADVADDNDVPEILTDTGIYAYKAEPLPGVPEKVNQAGSGLEPPIVRDVDGDTIPEMVTASRITNWNTQASDLADKKARSENLWNQDASVDDAAFVGMADLGDFRTALGIDSAEMVIVSNSKLLVTQVDGKVLLRVEASGAAAGPPVIADFDGDGRMEFASPGVDKITVYDLDCATDDSVDPKATNCKNPSGPNRNAILWQMPAHGAQSGASVFDFDGDRRAEVVYADQCFMRIMDGETGEVQFSVPRSSVTRWDYPVIADVDGDTHTEIVTASNDFNAAALGCPDRDALNTEEVRFVPSHGVQVWRDREQRWAGSRMTWNQHAYSVTNVHDDGTIPEMRSIPSQFTTPASDPNSLRQNVQGKTGVSLQLADITAWVDPEVKCQLNQPVATITASLCNRGTLDVPASTVNLQMMLPGNATTLCTKGNTGVLRSGGCESISCEVSVPDTLPGLDIMVLADSTNAVAECVEGRNNITMIRGVVCNRIQTR
jgi:hypothetical protein